MSDVSSDVPRMFYRYESYPDYQSICLRLVTFNFVKETPKGYRISVYGGKTKWIPKESHKRYAFPTEKEARKSFIARKERQLRLLNWQILDVEQALCAAEHGEMSAPRLSDYVME